MHHPRIVLALAAVAAISSFASGSSERASGKKFRVDLQLKIGNEEKPQARDTATLVNSSFLVLEGEESAFFQGGQFGFGGKMVRFGDGTRLLIRETDAGELRLRLVFERSARALPTNEEVARVDSQTFRYLGIVRLGKTVQQNFGKSDGRDVWMEITVNEHKDAGSQRK